MNRGRKNVSGAEDRFVEGIVQAGSFNEICAVGQAVRSAPGVLFKG